MSFPKTKKDFIMKLHSEMNRLNLELDSDILSDFEQHFENGIAQGLTEEEICQNLGNVREIAKSYLPLDQEIEITNENAETPQKAQAIEEKGSVAGFVLLLIADCLVLFWVLFGLGAGVFGFTFVPISIAISSIAVLFTGVVGVSSFVFVLFTSIFLMGLALLLAVCDIYLIRGFIWLCKWFLNLHLKLLGKNEIEVVL